MAGFSKGQNKFGKSNSVKVNSRSQFEKKVFKKTFRKSRKYHSIEVTKADLGLWIRQTYNNIFSTVADIKGNVKFTLSGGFSKLRGSNRNSIRSIDIISKILINRLEKLKSRKSTFFRTLEVFIVTTTNKVVKALLNNLGSFNQIIGFTSRIRVPHNGLRARKLRRLLTFSP